MMGILVKYWQRYFSKWQNWLALGLLLTFVALAVFAPLWAEPPDHKNPPNFKQIGRSTDHIPRPPDEKALLGTVGGQLDVFYTLVWGTRNAFRFGLVVTLVAGVFGIILGATSAYLGGWVEQVLMRISDAFLAFPVIAAIVFLNQMRLTALVNSGASLYSVGGLLQTEGEPGAWQSFLLRLDPVFIALILLSWMPYARLTHAAVYRVKGTDFVIAAQALGAGNGRILIKHLLPNSLSPALVLAARDVGGLVILQSTFTYLGLGGGSPWGQMLVIARNWVIGAGGNPLTYWWAFLPITLALILFCIGWNWLGDGINDWISIKR